MATTATALVRISTPLLHKLKLIAAAENTTVRRVLDNACTEFVDKTARENAKVRETIRPKALG